MTIKEIPFLLIKMPMVTSYASKSCKYVLIAQPDGLDNNAVFRDFI